MNLTTHAYVFSSCATCTKQRSVLSFTGEQCDRFFLFFFANEFAHSAMFVCVCLSLFVSVRLYAIPSRYRED